MAPSKVADRLRAIVGGGLGRPGTGGAPVHGAEAGSGRSRSTGDVEEVLGGAWRRLDGLSSFVVEQRFEPAARHGRERVQEIGARLAAASSHARLVLGTTAGADANGPLVFFDLETTGLSGGAGTVAFLVGCGAFDGGGGFVTRQFVLLRHADERQLLQMVGHELAQAGALVTFNGKSFDAPLIETRYLFHRLEWTGCRLPHLDVLHPARRFWSDACADSSCSLAILEGHVLGAGRFEDVAGSEIPARYFQFLRTGDAAPLVPVLRHNRLDLLSLAGLTARLLDLVRIGPEAAQNAREALALGSIYWRCGMAVEAREAYERALAAGPAPVRREAARALALVCRRARRWDDAAAFWRELLETPGCPPHLVREANRALAIHHEHRARNLDAARMFALKSLGAVSPAVDPGAAAWTRAARHRLARIERKMNTSQALRLDFRLEA